MIYSVSKRLRRSFLCSSINHSFNYVPELLSEFWYLLFLHLILYVTGMKSGCDYIKWALLPILFHNIYKSTILFVSGTENMGNVLTYVEDTIKLMGIIQVFFLKTGWQLEKKMRCKLKPLIQAAVNCMTSTYSANDFLWTSLTLSTLWGTRLQMEKMAFE